MISAGPESRFTPARPDCQHPERWTSTDSDSTEIEVSLMVAGLITGIQPDLVVETGTAFGQTAEYIGRALERNGQGRLVTFEVDEHRAEIATGRCDGLPVEIVEQSSIDGLKVLADQGEKAAFAWLDSLFELRVQELDLVREILAPGAVVGIHDCGEPWATKYPHFSRQVADRALNLGFTRISLPTPRGVTLLGWKG